MALTWLDMASVWRHIMVQDVFIVARDGVRMHNVSSRQSTLFTIICREVRGLKKQIALSVFASLSLKSCSLSLSLSILRYIYIHFLVKSLCVCLLSTASVDSLQLSTVPSCLCFCFHRHPSSQAPNTAIFLSLPKLANLLPNSSNSFCSFDYMGPKAKVQTDPCYPLSYISSYIVPVPRAFKNGRLHSSPEQVPFY